MDDCKDLTLREIGEYLAERALSDARHPEVIELDARSEDYYRDYFEALNDHDWFCNQCTGHDQFGERCKNRQGHRGGHSAGVNGFMQFLYSEEKINALVYDDNPLLAMVRR